MQKKTLPTDTWRRYPPNLTPQAGPAHLTAQTSFCGRYALLNSEDAKGIAPCWICGLYHPS